ncbi:MAG: S-layer homology domain-containing protein [Anaerotignum sp.]
MKKKITIALAAIMASSCLSVTGYAANFKDINDVPWEGSKEVINAAADLGLINGYEDSTFRAKNNVTYCEAMHMVYTVLNKAGTANTMDSIIFSKYAQIMQVYNIPTWSQNAVAYGLENSIITIADLAKFTAGGTNTYAPREEVAKMFGNALAVRYDMDSKAQTAMKFNDASRISSDCIVQVDLLARLEVVKGDSSNNFNPKNNINRAEMAVMLTNTYDVLVEGLDSKGVISEFEYDGSVYQMKITTELGESFLFYASPNNVTVYAGDTTTQLPLSRLAVGDEVEFAYNGGALETIRVLDGSSVQQKYNITGYIQKLTSSALTIENENTGEKDSFNLDSGCQFYLNNESIKKTDLIDELEENYDQYAYVGINTIIESEKENGSWVDKTYVTEVYVIFSDEYTSIGVVDKMDAEKIDYKPIDSNSISTIYFGTDCEYYIDDTEGTYTKLKELANTGTVYVRLTVDKTGKASKVVISEESFLADSSNTTTTYSVDSFTEKQMVLETSGNKYTYKFGSTNPVDNITFYEWDADDEQWNSVSISNAENYFDSFDDDDKLVYAQVSFNSGGKINKVYLSNKKAAWSQGEYSLTERKAEIASLDGNTLKFKNSSISYTLLDRYNVKYSGDTDALTGNVNGEDVKYPLTIEGAKTSSLTNFKKMVQAEGVTVYAEVMADGNNVIQSIEARPTAATGTLVSYDDDDKELVLESTDGQKITFTTTRRPSTGTDDYTYEDIATVGYVGSTLNLTFNSDGVVEKIEVAKSTNGKGIVTVEGIAVSAKDGLVLKGSSKVYGWLSRTNTGVYNYSGESTSLDKVQAAIDDEDVTVYVEVQLDDRDRVERINVYFREAEGAFQEYNTDANTVRILTDAGNKLTFNTTSKFKINIDDIAASKLNTSAVGKNVELTFNDDGLLESVEG